MTTKLLDLPELIEWHEGMLLTPQHFQQFAARTELLTQIMFTQAIEFRWGVIELKIDQAALSGGIFRVLNIQAVMPDGLLVLGGSERGVKLEFDLQNAERNPTRIYLTVPRDPALYTRTDYSRYEAFVDKDELTSDDVSGASAATIPRIRPRLRLDTEASTLGGFTSFPVVEFDAQGTVVRPTEFIAPLLAIKLGSPLASLCARVGKALREMATELAAKLRPNARKSDLAGVYQLQWLISGLPVFEALLESGQAHPYQLYLSLCSIAGNVAFLSNARVPPIFPPYNHDDLRDSFQKVVAFIQLALSEGLIENWVGREFTLAPKPALKAPETERGRIDQTYEIAPTLGEAFGPDADFSAPFLAFMLTLPPGRLPDSMTEWGESCLLAPEDAVGYLEQSRSRGAICERVDFLEDLVVAPSSVLFRVHNDPKWIDPGKKLVLKPAKQETLVPDGVKLFVKKRSQTNQGV